LQDACLLNAKQRFIKQLTEEEIRGYLWEIFIPEFYRISYIFSGLF